MQNLYQISLVTHIAGLAMMAGTTLASYLLMRQFWKQHEIDKPGSAAGLGSVAKISVLLGIGILLLIVSGVTMAIVVKGAYGQQTWFRIKMMLVIIAIINGTIIGRRLAMKLGKTLGEEKAGVSVADRLMKLKGNLNWFYISQLTIFLVIFTLSVFKFN